jgi:malonate-semialdehyde dehydrogenase (acetylating) / methylmalonate-semialdehyde dehydrogenase
MFSFTGAKGSFLGDMHFYGKEGFHFFTQARTVTALWREQDAVDQVTSATAFPVMR